MNQGTALDQEQIYQTLAKEILRFEHKPGDVISEHYLCGRFFLSRTPMRSVLQRLQENGLVHIVPRKGSMVTRLNSAVVSQMIYERVAVESMVLRDFILGCCASDVQRVREAMQALLCLCRDAEQNPARFDAQRFLQTDYAMHRIWFEATDKRFLWERLSGVQSSYTRFCTLDILEGNNVPDIISEHAAMLSLIEDRNTEGIEALMRRHLYGGMRRLSGLMFTKYACYFDQMQ